MNTNTVSIRNRVNETTQKKGWLAPALWTICATMIVPTCATAVVSGKSSVEKVLTAFTQPLFLMLFFSIVAALVLIRTGQRWSGAFMLLVSLLGWFASTGVVVDRLMTSWESQIPNTALSVERPFEYVVVLGGGTSISPDGRAQLGDSGDRVLLGAELLLNGYTRNLVTTGDALMMTGSLGGTRSPEDYPSAHTKKIWSKLKIPADVIFTLAGENTSKEMASLREHPEWWKEKRCGVITSAFHMPRAMRLSKAAGIQVEPIIANYRSDQGPLLVEDFLPDAHQAYHMKLLVKEWLAAIVSR